MPAASVKLASLLTDHILASSYLNCLVKLGDTLLVWLARQDPVTWNRPESVAVGNPS
jgi:hypothetical protein